MNRHAQLLSTTQKLLHSALIKIEKGHIFYATIFAELATNNLCVISNFTNPDPGSNSYTQELCEQHCPQCHKLCFGLRTHLGATNNYHACDSAHAWLDGSTSCLLDNTLHHLQVTQTTD